MSDGIAPIPFFNVAVLTGRQLSGAALAAQRHGPRPTFLHATDAGRPIDARMGYEAVSTHTCFIDTRFLAGH